MGTFSQTYQIIKVHHRVCGVKLWLTTVSVYPVDCARDCLCHLLDTQCCSTTVCVFNGSLNLPSTSHSLPPPPTNPAFPTTPAPPTTPIPLSLPHPLTQPHPSTPPLPPPAPSHSPAYLPPPTLLYVPFVILQSL